MMRCRRCLAGAVIGRVSRLPAAADPVGFRVAERTERMP
jgi:hypothetical protein